MTKKKESLKQTSFYLTEDLMKAVGFRAIQDQVDKSSVVREALAVYLRDTIDLLQKIEEEEQMSEKQKEKRSAWDVALGLMKIDVEPTEEFKEEVEREIRGEITTEDMLQSWEKRHKVNGNEEDPV